MSTGMIFYYSGSNHTMRNAIILAMSFYISFGLAFPCQASPGSGNGYGHHSSLTTPVRNTTNTTNTVINKTVSTNLSSPILAKFYDDLDRVCAMGAANINGIHDKRLVIGTAVGGCGRVTAIKLGSIWHSGPNTASVDYSESGDFSSWNASYSRAVDWLD